MSKSTEYCSSLDFPTLTIRVLLCQSKPPEHWGECDEVKGQRSKVECIYRYLYLQRHYDDQAISVGMKDFRRVPMRSCTCIEAKMIALSDESAATWTTACFIYR